MIVLVAMGGLCVLDLMDRHAAFAARNSSGTYSLPSGNPVVSGTVISSSTYNNTTSDMAGEITNSLDRNGRGAMLAPLQLFSGSAVAPGLTFAAGTNDGWYRIGTHDLGLALNGVKGVEWSGAGATETVSGLVSGQSGLVVNGNAAGSADVIQANGNANGSIAIHGVAGTQGLAIRGDGAGTGGGVAGYGGGTSGIGVFGAGGGGDADAVEGMGAAGGIGTGIHGIGGSNGGFGGVFENGVAATGGTRQTAIVAKNGDIDLSGVANPLQGTALKNLLTPASFVKMFAQVQTAGSNSTSCTVQSGMNVASCAAINASGNTCVGSETLHVTIPTSGAFAQNNNNVCFADCAYGAGAPAPDDHTSNHAYLTGANPNVTIALCGVQFTHGAAGAAAINVWNAYTTIMQCFVQCIGQQ